MKLFANVALVLPLILSTAVYAESFSCKDGEPSSFILESLPNLDDAPDVVVGESTLLKFSPDSNNQIQLDVCLTSDDTAELQTVHILDHGQKHSLNSILSVEGLAPALFGDFSSLNIVAEVPNEDGLVYEVKGWTKGETSLVSMMPLQNHKTIDERVLVGALAYGEAEFVNQAASTQCAAGESEHQDSFKIVEATVKATVCTRVTADRSTAIRFVEATLIDGQIHHEFEAADFAEGGSFRYVWTHHNLSDQLYIAIPEGVYQSKRGTGEFYDAKTGKPVMKNSVRMSIGWVPMGIAQRITYANGEEKIARDNDALSILSVDNQ